MEYYPAGGVLHQSYHCHYHLATRTRFWTRFWTMPWAMRMHHPCPEAHLSRGPGALLLRDRGHGCIPVHVQLQHIHDILIQNSTTMILAPQYLGQHLHVRLFHPTSYLHPRTDPTLDSHTRVPEDIWLGRTPRRYHGGNSPLASTARAYDRAKAVRQGYQITEVPIGVTDGSAGTISSSSAPKTECGKGMTKCLLCRPSLGD